MMISLVVIALAIVVAITSQKKTFLGRQFISTFTIRSPFTHACVPLISPCRYGLVDSVRALDKHGLRYWDWKWSQWGFTSAGVLVLVDIAGASTPDELDMNFTIGPRIKDNNAKSGQAKSEEMATMESLITRFWARGKYSPVPDQPKTAAELRNAMARARDLARSSGKTPLPILSHISRARFAQSVLFAARSLTLSRKPEVMMADPTLHQIDRALLQDATARFQVLQSNLAVDTMDETQGPADKVHNALRSILKHSCGSVDTAETTSELR